MATIAAGYPRGLVSFAETRGAERAVLLSRAGLSEETLSHADNRVDVEAYLALFRAAAELTGDPAIALHYGQGVRMQEISIVGLICEACETTIEVGPALNRYAQLVIDDECAEPAVLMRGQWTPEGVWIEAPHELFNHRFMAEAEFARLTWNGRVMFKNSAEFQALKYPREIHFKHADPGYGAEYARVFDSKVVFNAKWNAMLVDTAFLSLKQPPVNAYVFGVLSERADALVKSLQDARSMRGRVEALIAPVLHSGEISMDAIAAKLGMSRQTLYRALKAEDLTFEAVLDDLRRRVALNFLADRKVTINEIAYLTGFSEAAAFSRAFKRWTGESPSAARKS